MKLSTTSLALAVLLAAPVRAEERQPKPPKQAEEPFLVFVDANPKGEESVVNAILEARDELEERLRKNDKWFRVVEDRDDAEIAVELLAYWSRTERDVRDQTYVAGGRTHTTQIDVVQEHHTLQAAMEVFGVLRQISGIQVKRGRGSAKGAARELARELEEHCKEHYWELMERRHRRAGSS